MKVKPAYEFSQLYSNKPVGNIIVIFCKSLKKDEYYSVTIEGSGDEPRCTIMKYDGTPDKRSLKKL